MLDNIKSKYILKLFLSYVKEKKKLNLVKYNKNMQTKININLLYYKIFSGNYTTIYDDNNDNKRGKIFDEYKNQIIFEGEFSNGKKNGIGKEYINERLIFEGEYVNGEKKGKWKEYYDNERIKYEGEYHYGERNGKGKEYYKNGELKFEGEYKNGKMYEGSLYDNKIKKIYELKKREM